MHDGGHDGGSCDQIIKSRSCDYIETTFFLFFSWGWGKKGGGGVFRHFAIVW